MTTKSPTGRGMEMLHVEGLVAPFNRPNSYNETFLPGAFSRFIERTGITLMMVEHEGAFCGIWTRLWETGEGLMAEGYAASDVARWYATKPGLGTSATFNDEDVRRPRTHWSSSDNAGKTVFKEHIVRHAGLSEISLTSAPAFPGTWLRPLDTLPVDRADALLDSIDGRIERMLAAQARRSNPLDALMQMLREGGRV